MKVISFAGLYAAFCLASMGVNIGIQALASYIYRGPLALYVAMFFGTGAGLVTKYILDRKWIFRHQSQCAIHEMRTAVLYTLMGIVTTLIFWAAEWSFDRILGTDYRYIGAVVGLAMGYNVKYFLDRRFVFASTRAST